MNSQSWIIITTSLFILYKSIISPCLLSEHLKNCWLFYFDVRNSTISDCWFNAILWMPLSGISSIQYPSKLDIGYIQPHKEGAVCFTMIIHNYMQTPQGTFLPLEIKTSPVSVYLSKKGASAFQVFKLSRVLQLTPLSQLRSAHKAPFICISVRKKKRSGFCTNYSLQVWVCTLQY